MVIKAKGAHRSFHSVVVMVRPSVSVVMAECFCCSSWEIKELPGMCGFVYMCLCECEKERGVQRWRAKLVEIVPLSILWSRSSHIRLMHAVCMHLYNLCFAHLSYLLCAFSPIYLSGTLIGTLCVVLCSQFMSLRRARMTLLYMFVCAVQRSICHLFSVKGWPTFSCASALCSGWVGVHENTVYGLWTWTPREHCCIDFTASTVSFFLDVQ